MNRVTMRDLLRRRLNDPEVGGTFSNAELNTMLNVSLCAVEKEILKIRPYAFLQWELWDITANQERYPLTVGTINLVCVGRRTDPAARFSVLERKDLRPILNGEASGYCHAGREVVLSTDLVTQTIAQGLRAIHVPALELSDDASTTEDKGLPRPLDMAVVVWAQEYLTPEQGSARKEAAEERRELLADLPQYFVQDTDGPSVLKLDFVKYPSGVL